MFYVIHALISLRFWRHFRLLRFVITKTLFYWYVSDKKGTKFFRLRHFASLVFHPRFILPSFVDQKIYRYSVIIPPNSYTDKILLFILTELKKQKNFPSKNEKTLFWRKRENTAWNSHCNILTLWVCSFCLSCSFFHFLSLSELKSAQTESREKQSCVWKIREENSTYAHDSDEKFKFLGKNYYEACFDVVCCLQHQQFSLTRF